MLNGPQRPTTSFEPSAHALGSIRSSNQMQEVVMGHLSLLIALSVLFILAISVGGFVWLLVRLSRRKTSTSRNVPGTTDSSASQSPDSRLRQLAALREQGLVNEVEYNEKRASIISSV